MEKGKGEKMKKQRTQKTKKCSECKQTMVLGKTTLHFQKGAFYSDVQNVPAYLCSQCGHRSIRGSVSMNILKTINILFERASAKGVRNSFSGISFQQIAA